MDRERFVPPESRQEKRRITSANLLSCLEHPEQYDVDSSVLGYIAAGDRPEFAMRRPDARRLAMEGEHRINAETARQKELVERVLPVLQEYGNIFGPNARLDRTHVFDQRFRQADFLLTIEDGKEPIECIIDVMVGTSDQELMKRFLRDRERVMDGRMGNVSYAKNPTSDLSRTLEDVPRVVWPFDPDGLDDNLFQPAASVLRRQSAKERQLINGELTKSSLPSALLDISSLQLREQLELIQQEKGKRIPVRSAERMHDRLVRLSANIEGRRDASLRHAKFQLDRVQQKAVGIFMGMPE